MELQAIRRLAKAKRLVRASFGTGQGGGSVRDIERVIVPFDGFQPGQSIKQGIDFTCRVEPNWDQTDLRRGSEMHLCIQCFRQQLAAQANAQDCFASDRKSVV